MRKFGLLGSSALRSAVLVGFAIAAASPGLAQTTPPPAEDEEGVTEAEPAENLGQNEVELESGQDADSPESIVVTGSRIRRPNLESNVPITSVGIQELTDTGEVSLGDALNDLPSLRSTFGSGNSGRFIGTAGLSLLDLRGLGTTRTLVLVNGRRHITSTPGDFQIDVNTIPTDLTERVDIVTGGNSAIYGSDAVAGVVNFILKRNFEGIRVRGQAGITERGDRGNYFASLTAGQNFADDRGNVAMALEYAKAQPVLFTDRPDLTGAFGGRCQFNVAENTAGEPGGSDNIPDQQFFCGVRNAGISTGGTIGVLSAATGSALRFDSNGNLFRDMPTQSFFPFGSGNVQGGEGTTLRETGQLAVGVDRYAANLLGSFEISPALQPFVEAKFVRVDSLQEGQPSFFQGNLRSFFGGGALTGFRCNNPFLTAQALGELRAVGLCANPATGTFSLARFNTDFGGRGEEFRRDTFRVVGGVQGDFNEDWRYEVALNYGRLDTKLKSLNNLRLFDLDGNATGFLTAIDAVRAPSGQIVCRINADASTANDDPACVPINVFGLGAPSREALAFVNTTSTRDEKATQFVASAFLSGDLSQLFELPGGAVGFAVGAEYRKEKSFSEFDELVQSGGTFLNAIPTFDPPTFEVKEVFGEVRFPLLRNLPFAEELTVEAAARYSDYNTSADKTFTYNLGGTYAPVRDLRFRANYSKSVRVPTPSDLFTPPTENFAQVADPCDSANIGNNPNRIANCAAGGVPRFNTAATEAECRGSAFEAVSRAGLPFVNCLARSFTTGFVSSGNAGLEEETGKSLTLGGVFTPSFLPGFSLTVDYYDITVKNLIAAPAAGAIINACFDSPEAFAVNPFCATIRRDPTSGLFAEPAVVAQGFNFARQEAEGIDVETAYRHTFGNGHRLNLRAIGTWVLTRTNFTSPTDPDFPNRIKSELGDPEYSANLNANYDLGVVDIGYNLRYIGKQVIGAFEERFAFNGSPPFNEDLTPQKFYPDAFYHSARVGIEVNPRFKFYGGVDNLFDKQPPLGLLGTAGGDPFDSFGRSFYAGAEINF